MMKKSSISLLLVGMLLASGMTLAAQEEPAPSGPGAPTQGSAPAPTAQSASSTNRRVPLSGAYVPTPEAGTETPSYFLPSLEWTTSWNTNPSTITARPSAALQNTLIGNITLQRTKRTSQFNLDYKGGAVFYSGVDSSTQSLPPPPNATYQSLQASQSIMGKRWSLDLSDKFSFLPESPFGFSGFGGLSSFGSGLGGSYLASAPTINPTYEPSQAILTRRSRRLGNVALGQVNYQASKRSIYTFTGGYGNLHFLDPGFIDSHYWKASAGYNYELSRADTLALVYTHTEFRFATTDRSVVNEVVTAAYGHRITGRLSLEVSGGPMITQIEQTGGSETRYLVDTYNSLHYKLDRGYLQLSFERFGSNGSGVLTGAVTNVTRFSTGHRLSRKTFGSLEVRYSTNRSIALRLAGGAPEYKTWGPHVNLSRDLTERVSIYLVYYLQHQTTDRTVCINQDCTDSLTRNVFGIGLNWHGRPIRLD